MNKTIVIGLVLVVAVIGVLFYMMNQGSPSYQAPTSTPTPVLTESPANLPTSSPTTTPTQSPTASPQATKTPASVPATHAVMIQGFAFNQSSITIKKGDTVVWTNKDPVSHTVTGDGGLASSNLSPNGTYSFKFNTAGTFNYHCSIHPSMTGTVTVVQ